MDEKALIQAARKGDVPSFNQLVLLYQNLAYNVAYRILGNADAANDATQDAFVSAFKAMRKFRGGSFKSWVLRIVTNKCYDQLRAKQRRPTTRIDDTEIESDYLTYLTDPGESPGEYVERQALSQVLQKAILALPPHQRTVVVLSDVQGLNYQEIADVLDISLGTVKSRLSRARAALRDSLQANRELLPRQYRLTDEAA
jgi:RNA polymerase sigma-70 factor (ECF subfamily)